MSAQLSLPDPRPVRLPSVILAWWYLCLVGRLIWIWGELWPVLPVAGIALWRVHLHGLGELRGRWVWAAGVLALAILLRSKLRGEFHKNVGDSYGALVRLDWRTARLMKSTLPKLVKVEVREPYTVRRALHRRREDGVWGLPAGAARIEMRPHSADTPTQVWAELVEWWATNRYAFSSWEPLQPSKRSPHILVLDMGELIIPDMVTAGKWA
jgi:hypothetical protein